MCKCLCLHEFMCITYVQFLEEIRGEFDISWDRKLQAVLNCIMGPGNQILALCKAVKALCC